MAMTDCRGVPVSTGSKAALAQLEAATELLHGYFADPMAAVDAAVAAEPDCVMAHCLRGGMLATATEKAAEPALRQAIATAQAGPANERERGHIAALAAWADGDWPEAVARWTAVLDAWPRDSLALQFAHLGDFYLGQSGMLRDRVARVLPAWDESVPGYGFVLGMHAFGLEESGDYGRAEEQGRAALHMNARDPWAVHAVAHVMEMQARFEDGADWLERREADWAPGNMFAFHNWWHLCLYKLEQHDTAGALAIYDRMLKPRQGIAVLELLDASALLWRLRLRGVEAGARWAALADAWEPLAEDTFYAFNDMHAMMAFVAAGREDAARRLIEALERRAAGGGVNAMMSREVGLPVARALKAFGAGRYGVAAALLERVRPSAARFGGSHAQRDVLSLTLLEAALRGGERGRARALAAERRALKPNSPLGRWFAERAAAL